MHEFWQFQQLYKYIHIKTTWKLVNVEGPYVRLENQGEGVEYLLVPKNTRHIFMYKVFE